MNKKETKQGSAEQAQNADLWSAWFTAYFALEAELAEYQSATQAT